MIARLVLMAAWVAIHSSAQAGDRPDDDPLSPDISNCSGPASTPACASWTWSLCNWTKDRDLCALIGMKDLVFVGRLTYDDIGNPLYPPEHEGRIVIPSTSLWVETLDAGLEGKIVGPGDILIYVDGKPPIWNSRIIGVREVARIRFENPDIPEGYEVPERLIGTHEVMIGAKGGSGGVSQSEFFRKEEGRWKLVSWGADNEDCQFRGEYRMRADCRINIPTIRDWHDYYPVEDWCPKPRDGWCPP